MGQKVHPMGFRRAVPAAVADPKAYISGGEAHFDRRDPHRLSPNFDRGTMGKRYNQMVLLQSFAEEIFEKSGYLLSNVKIREEEDSFSIALDCYWRRGTSLPPKLSMAEQRSPRRKLTWTPRPLSWRTLRPEDLAFYAEFFQKHITQGRPVRWQLQHLEAPLSSNLAFALQQGLSRHRQRPYFQDALNILQIICQRPGAALLANFMATELQDMQRQQAFVDMICQGLEIIALNEESQLQGVLLQVKGRASGADRSKRFQYRKGSIPLHSLRAPIDFGFSEILSSYGRSSIKIWLKYL